MKENSEEKIETLDDVVKNEKHPRKEKKNKEVEKLQEEKRDLNDKLLRISAEMQNMRKRYDEEIARMYKYEGEGLIKELLSTLDNFERAIMTDESKLSELEINYLKGFKMIYTHLVNNFERAISQDNDNLEDELSKFLSGFKLIYSEFRTKLENKGLSEIKCQDEAFDPTFMEAVLTEKVEGKESGIVIDVLQKGYKFNDKVIRPAMVKVSE